jgi:hypothetical protein
MTIEASVYIMEPFAVRFRFGSDDLLRPRKAAYDLADIDHPNGWCYGVVAV